MDGLHEIEVRAILGRLISHFDHRRCQRVSMKGKGIGRLCT